ncbi:hypothetical protein [Enterobacter kobei]|uniref:hypothetical protein n=1 Tax=Enterobacter kobei TaxID=208224 RepID=UPI0032AF4EC5
MNIETVNELIASLESAGELSIREQKFLKLAKEFRICSASLDAAIKTGNMLADQNAQLAAENAALKSAHPQPFGREMMKALDAYEKHQDETPETGMLDAFFVLRDSIRVDTTATDAFLAEVRAQGVEMLVKHCEQKALEKSYDFFMDAGAVAAQFAAQLRQEAQ